MATGAVMLVASLLASSASVYQSRSQAKKDEKEKEEMLSQQKAKEEAAQQKIFESEEAERLDVEKRTQLKKGRTALISTSPTGVLGSPTVGRRKLLGN